MKQNKPPRLANILLRMILQREDYLEKTGDLEEVYSSLCGDKGKPIAIAWYWMQVLTAIPVIISNSFYWSMVMLKNYFKLALRNMLKQKVYSLITITGLAFGLGIFLFIFHFYQWQTNNDGFHKGIDRMYNIVQVINASSEGDRHTEYIPYPLTTAVKNEIPEVEEATSIIRSEQVILKYNEKKFFENRVVYVDTNYLSFFTFNIIEGSAKTILSKPNSIVLSKSMAVKYFGNDYPLGKVITFANKLDLLVTGVIEDSWNYPSVTSIPAEFLVSMDVFNSLENKLEDWNECKHTGFIKIKKGIKAEQIDSKLSGIVDKYFPKNPESPKRLYLFPVKGNIFAAEHIQKYSGHDNPQLWAIFLILGILILLIVCVNFMNLATARYIHRSKEVGIRKTIGAKRFQLIAQFLSETVLTTFISTPLACAVCMLFGSWLNAKYGAALSFSVLNNKNLLFVLIITSLATSILSGLYPSFILSSLKPISVIKNNGKSGKGKGKFRKVLVVGQLVVSIVFMVITLTWIKQTNYVHNADLGYNKENILLIPTTKEAKSDYSLFKEELKRNPEIISVAAAENIPGRWGTRDYVTPEGKTKNDAFRIYYYGINYDFIETLGISLISGRTFSKDYIDENSFIITQSFSKRLGWNDPIGRNIEAGGKKGVIIGLVKDLHFAGTGWTKIPAIFYIEQKNLNQVFIKISGTENVTKVKEYVKTTWNKLLPGIPCELTTLKASFDDTLVGQNAITEFVGAIGFLAMFFSCLGLLAMISFSTNARKKEIAIRKVHGATIQEILILLGKDYVRIIIYASLIGLPIAFYLTEAMLSPFSVRILVGINVLILTFFLTAMISLAFIIKEILKAAKQQPVETLKCE